MYFKIEDNYRFAIAELCKHYAITDDQRARSLPSCFEDSISVFYSQEDEAFIPTVENHNIIYDITHPFYKDDTKKGEDVDQNKN